MNDGVLLERAREYDAQALAEIYDRYAESIYRYAYRYVGDANLAEDLTSEVFLKLLQVLGTTRAPREQLQGWLYRVARNLAVDWFRQQAKGVPYSLNEEVTPGGDSPATRLEEQQLHQDLREAINKLTPSQQQVIVLRFGEGRKISEVARLMGKSEGSIKVMQYRAMKRLRKLLEKQGKRENEAQRSKSWQQAAQGKSIDEAVAPLVETAQLVSALADPPNRTRLIRGPRQCLSEDADSV